jgi:hypothetical protein
MVPPYFANAKISGKTQPTKLSPTMRGDGGIYLHLSNSARSSDDYHKPGDPPPLTSAANAAIDTVRFLTTKTPSGGFHSVAGCCGLPNYGIPHTIYVLVPIASDGKSWEIVQGLHDFDFIRAQLDAEARRELKRGKDTRSANYFPEGSIAATAAGIAAATSTKNNLCYPTAN